MAAFANETNHQRFLKAITYVTILDDYCKQIVKESDTIRSFRYNIIADPNGQTLTDIILNNFYSSTNSLFLKLGHNPNGNTYVPILPNGEYAGTLLTANCNRVPANHNGKAVNYIIDIHRNDIVNIGSRKFANWV